MNAPASGEFKPWRCHAHPPALNGKPCGFLNEQPRTSWAVLGGRSLMYCAACGCTKHASDLREAEALRGEVMIDLLIPTIVGLHMATAHFGAAPDAELSAATPGVYMRTADGLTLGAYRNSHGAGSVYAGWTWSTSDGVWSITAGAVTGYPRAAVAALVAPSVRLSLGGFAPGWAARIAYLPKPYSDGAHGLHLSVERGL